MIEKEVISDLDSALTGLAEAIAESTEFKEFESARLALSQDLHARQSLAEFEAKVSEVDGLPLQAAISAELERLQDKALSFPTVSRWFAAQETLTELCVKVAAAIESATGFDFAVGCATTRGCC